MKRRYTVKIRNVILIVFLIAFAIGVCYSTTDVIIWMIDANKVNTQVEELQEITDVKEYTSEVTENVEIIEQTQEVNKANPYWDYIKMSMINVDFSELKQKNSDTKGWIQVNGTNINYPFVQSVDNEYYLNKSFNKNNNSAGWIFLDYRNSITDLDRNTIIYGHSRWDSTMLGSLKNILTNGWLNNTDNHVIKISTEYENTLWQVISVYHIPVTSDYLEIDFSTDREFMKFANMLMNRSVYNFNTNVSEDDKLLTLSSCYNDDTERVVLHAKLIKREAK